MRARVVVDVHPLLLRLDVRLHNREVLLLFGHLLPGANLILKDVLLDPLLPLLRDLLDVVVGLDLDSEAVDVDVNVITFGARLEEKLVVFHDLPIADVEPDSVEVNLRIGPDEVVNVALSDELSVLSLLEEGNDLLSCLVLDFPFTE